MQNGSGIGPSAGAGSSGSRRALAPHNWVLCALEILAGLGVKTLELCIRLGFCRCVLLLVNREPCRDGRVPRLTRCHPSSHPRGTGEQRGLQ